MAEEEDAIGDHRSAPPPSASLHQNLHTVAAEEKRGGGRGSRKRDGKAVDYFGYYCLRHSDPVMSATDDRAAVRQHPVATPRDCSAGSHFTADVRPQKSLAECQIGDAPGSTTASDSISDFNVQLRSNALLPCHGRGERGELQNVCVQDRNSTVSNIDSTKQAAAAGSSSGKSEAKRGVGTERARQPAPASPVRPPLNHHAASEPVQRTHHAHRDQQRLLPPLFTPTPVVFDNGTPVLDFASVINNTVALNIASPPPESLSQFRFNALPRRPRDCHAEPLLQDTSVVTLRTGDAKSNEKSSPTVTSAGGTDSGHPSPSSPRPKPHHNIVDVLLPLKRLFAPARPCILAGDVPRRTVSAKVQNCRQGGKPEDRPGEQTTSSLSATLVSDEKEQQHDKSCGEVKCDQEKPQQHNAVLPTAVPVSVSAHPALSSRGYSETKVRAKYGKLGKIVGRGSGGTVRLIKRNADRKLFAVKEFRPKLPDEDRREYTKRLTNEFCIGSTLHHQNICETLEIFEEDNKFYEVMEYCPTDLFALVQNGSLDCQGIDCLFAQIIRGVDYLHSVGIAHRDLKLDNCVISFCGPRDNAKACLKIIDFGCSTVFRVPWESRAHECTGVYGSDPYIAPEEFLYDRYDARCADVWAAAVIYVCMSARCFPWRVARADHDPRYKQFITKHRSPCVDALPSPTRAVIYRMLDPEPTERATIEEVLADPWVSKIETCCAGTGHGDDRCDAPQQQQSFATVTPANCKVKTSIPSSTNHVHELISATMELEEDVLRR